MPVSRWVPMPVLLFLAAVAPAAGWACVPYPFVSIEPRPSGAPGTEVTVTGVGFGPETAEVRLNALDGQQLASATGPTFSTKVVIPDVPDGLYTLVVVGRSEEGSVTSKAAAALEVRRGAGVEATSRDGTSAMDSQQGEWSPVRTFGGLIVGALIVACLGALVGGRLAARGEGTEDLPPGADGASGPGSHAEAPGVSP